MEFTELLVVEVRYSVVCNWLWDPINPVVNPIPRLQSLKNVTILKKNCEAVHSYSKMLTIQRPLICVEAIRRFWLFELLQYECSACGDKCQILWTVSRLILVSHYDAVQKWVPQTTKQFSYSKAILKVTRHTDVAVSSESHSYHKMWQLKWLHMILSRECKLCTVSPNLEVI
jgi:hypothetical protein